jgi:hypothetical protein
VTARKKKPSADRVEAMRAKIEEARRKKHALQKRRYGGIFIRAWSPQFHAWRAFEQARGDEHPGKFDRTPLGFGFFRPTEWPPSAKTASGDAPRDGPESESARV